MKKVDIRVRFSSPTKLTLAIWSQSQPVPTCASLAPSHRISRSSATLPTSQCRNTSEGVRKAAPPWAVHSRKIPIQQGPHHQFGFEILP